MSRRGTRRRGGKHLSQYFPHTISAIRGVGDFVTGAANRGYNMTKNGLSRGWSTLRSGANYARRRITGSKHRRRGGR